MAKTKKEKNELPVKSSLPTGMKAKDLSLEKRIELATAEWEKFQEMLRDQFGLGMGTELTGYPRALVGRITLVDLLAKPNETKENQKQA